MTPTAKAEATDWSSVRGLPSAPVESTARGAFQSTASRTRRAAEETSAGGEATGPNATALEGTSAKARWSERPRPDGCPRGQSHRMERRQAIWPPRYNHLHLGGPVRARQTQNQLNSRRNAIPAASLRRPRQHRTTAQTTLQPALAIRLQPRVIATGCLAITLPVDQTAKAGRIRTRSRSTAMLPDTSGS